MVEGTGELLAAAAEGAPVQNSCWELLNLSSRMESERFTDGFALQDLTIFMFFLFLPVLAGSGWDTVCRCGCRSCAL